jgi:hypothetical protein
VRTVSPPPRVHKREVRVVASNTDARLRALETQMRLARFWISLGLTLGAVFTTVIVVAVFYWRMVTVG